MPGLPELPEVVTARLRVRPVTAADLPALMAVNGDEAVVLHLPYPAWRTTADAEAWLDRTRQVEAMGTGRQYVLAHADDGRAIGTLLIFRHEPASARAELGYALARTHWRRGLMREALQAVCAAAFMQAGLRRLEAEVHPDNQASNDLLSSLGFTLEGRLRQRWQAKGAAYDVNHWGLLAGEQR